MATTAKLRQECTQDVIDTEFSLGASLSRFRDIPDGVQYQTLLFVHVQSTTTGKWVEGFGYITSSAKDTVRIHKIEDTSVNTFSDPDLSMIDFGSETLEMFVTPGSEEAFNKKKGKLGILETYQSNMPGFNAEASAKGDPIASNIVQLARRGRTVKDNTGTSFTPDDFYLPVLKQQDMQHISNTSSGGGFEKDTNSWAQYFANHVAKNLAPLGDVCRIGCASNGQGFLSGLGQMSEPNGLVVLDIIDRLNSFWAENPNNYVQFILSTGGEIDAQTTAHVNTYVAEYDAFWSYLRTGANGRLKFNAIQPLELWSHVSAINSNINDNSAFQTTDNRGNSVRRHLSKAPYRTGNHRMASIPSANILAEGDGVHFNHNEHALQGERSISLIDIANNNNLVAGPPDVAPELVNLKRTSDDTVDLTVWEIHAFPDTLTGAGNGIVVQTWDKTTFPNTETWVAITGSPFAQTESATNMKQTISMPAVAAEKLWGVRIAGKNDSTVNKGNGAGVGPYRVLRDIDPLVLEYFRPSSSGNGVDPFNISAEINVNFLVNRTKTGSHAEGPGDGAVTWQANIKDSTLVFHSAGNSAGLLAAGGLGQDQDASDLWTQSHTILQRVWIPSGQTGVGPLFGLDDDTNGWELFWVNLGTDDLNTGQDGTAAAVTFSLTGHLSQWITVATVADETAQTKRLYFGKSGTNFIEVGTAATLYDPRETVVGQTARLGSHDNGIGGFDILKEGRIAETAIWNAAVSVGDMIEKMESWSENLPLPDNVTPGGS